MNGIKTIETSELIFTDDNSTLNTSAGITQAQSTGQTAINKSISAVGFNTGSGVLTLTTQGTGEADLTQNLDGRYLTSSSGFVTTSGTQNIAGVKTFTDQPKASGTIDTDQHLITRGFANGEYVKDTGTGQIDGTKTFTTFPIKSGTGTDLNPTADNQLTTKKYVDDNAGTGDVIKSGTNAFTGTNTFNTNRPTSTLPYTALPPSPASNEFITRNDADNLYGGGGKTFEGFYIVQGPQSFASTGILVWDINNTNSYNSFPSSWNAGTNRFTIPKAGRWKMSVQAIAMNNSITYMYFFIQKNSLQTNAGRYFFYNYFVPSNVWQHINCDMIFDCVVGDYFDIQNSSVMAQQITYSTFWTGQYLGV